MHLFHLITRPAHHAEHTGLYEENPASTGWIHFGGLLNSYYPADLLAITGATQFGFSGNAPAGGIELEFHLHPPGETSGALSRVTVSQQGPFTHALPKFPIHSGQRLTVLASAIPSDAKWFCQDTHGARVVKLAIVICTFNNGPRILENIRILYGSRFWNQSDAELVVVDNGTEKVAGIEAPRCHYFAQANLGGAGGFGRGMFEVTSGSLADRGFTHILLMDDDVKFDPEIIPRAISYHQNAKEDCVIGASMLRQEKPTFLHEAGARLRFRRSLGGQSTVPAGDITETGALAKLGGGVRNDYNAWWFCSFPVKAVDTCGLPLPIFIHGDDIEYGLRLKRHGIPTYTPGGLSLWHDSFESKRRTWIKYFDFRNALIRLCSDPGIAQDDLVSIFKRLSRNALMKNDYGGARMTHIALVDFLRGPEVLHDTDFRSIIGRLASEHGAYESQLTPPSRPVHEVDCDRLPRPCRLIRWTKFLTANLQWLPLSSRIRYRTNSERYNWWDVPFLADVEIVSGNERLIRPRDRGLIRRIDREKNELLNSKVAELPDVMERWRSALPVFQSPEFWKNYQ